MTSTFSAPSVPLLLRRLAAEAGPRLTWYGDDAERIELSGPVADNWVTKSVNLLVEEYRCGPGTRVALDLPVHWRTVLWALAVWRTGGCVVVADPAAAPDPARADIVVTDRPDRWADVVGVPGAPEVVVVALPALARESGPLPAGAFDAAAALGGYGDILTWVPDTELDRPALDLPGLSLTHGDLLDWAAQEAAPGPGERSGRVLVRPGSQDLAPLLATTLAVYAADGSLVLASVGRGAELAADAAALEHLVATERVTA